MVRRTLIAATIVSLAISAMFLFQGGGLRGIVVRSVSYLVFGWTGSLLGIVCARIVWRLGLAGEAFWRGAFFTGLLMAPPMCVVVLTVVSVANGGPPARSAWPDILWQTLVVCVAMSFLSVLISRRAAESAKARAEPPKFLERIPLKLRGGELWAVEAEDHYLRLHTSKGQDLILMRLADAIHELEGIEGAQVHRSWWVARDAVTDARRGDGRALLTLKDGSEVPVSRTYARTLRERRWI